MESQGKRTMSDADFMGFFASMHAATEMGFARIEGCLAGVEGRLTSIDGRLTSLKGG